MSKFYDKHKSMIILYLESKPNEYMLRKKIDKQHDDSIPILSWIVTYLYLFFFLKLFVNCFFVIMKFSNQLRYLSATMIKRALTPNIQNLNALYQRIKKIILEIIMNFPFPLYSFFWKTESGHGVLVFYIATIVIYVVAANKTYEFYILYIKSQTDKNIEIKLFDILPNIFKAIKNEKTKKQE